MNVEFTAYFSRLKLSGALISILCCFSLFIFDGVDNHTYFRWLFLPWAFPLRVLLIIGGLGLILLIFRLLILAFANAPVIQVSNGSITLRRWKTATFPISSITEIEAISNNRYKIRIGDKKYSIPNTFFRDPDLLDANMEKLINVIHF